VKECRNTYSLPECNEHGKAEGHGRCTEEVDWSVDSGNKICSCLGQRPGVIEEDCTGSQGPQRTVLLEKK
jgi:hypothetical protein